MSSTAIRDLEFNADEHERLLARMQEALDANWHCERCGAWFTERETIGLGTDTRFHKCGGIAKPIPF